MQSSSREVRTSSAQSASSRRQVFRSLVTLVSRLNLYISSEAMDFRVTKELPQISSSRKHSGWQIPVIGIGAGSGVDGQVLVSQAMLGMEDRFAPKFLRRFASLGEEIKQAAEAYITAVKERSFPSDAESY